MNIIYMQQKSTPGFAKVHTNYAKLLCVKVILTRTGLTQNKSLNYLGASDCFL